MILPLVSVIIPTYNREHLLGETLDSVLSQTYTNLECIVIDDGSVDGTAQLMNSYCLKDSRIKYLHRPKDRLQGGNDARNYGYEVANGHFIQWFDDDDLMLKEFLQLKVNAFKESTDFVICTGKYLKNNSIDSTSIDIKIKTTLYKDYVLFHSKIFTPSVMFRREYLEHKQLFKLDIVRGQESEFFSRLFFEMPKERYKIINKPLFLYRQHEQSKSQLNEQYIKDYKTSEIYVALEHLKRGIVINDLELIQYFYRLLVNFLFRAIENNDQKNVSYLRDSFFTILKPIDKKLVYKLIVATKCFLFLNRGFYSVEMYFKTYKLTNV